MSELSAEDVAKLRTQALDGVARCAALAGRQEVLEELGVEHVLEATATRHVLDMLGCRSLAEAYRLCEAGRAASADYDIDWTASEGRSNSSEVYLRLVDEVARLIRDSGFSLLSGQTETVARVIVSRMAHKHGLVPLWLPTGEILNPDAVRDA